MATDKPAVWWKATFEDGFTKECYCAINPAGAMSSWGKKKGHGLCVRTERIPHFSHDLTQPKVERLPFQEGIVVSTTKSDPVEDTSEIKDFKKIMESVQEVAEQSEIDLDDELIKLIAEAIEHNKTVGKRLEKLFDFASESDEDIFDSTFLSMFANTILDEAVKLKLCAANIIDNLEIAIDEER